MGGTVSGLAGTGLVLQNNAGNDLTINNNGGFSFGTPIASGAPYAVTVKTQPTVPSQTCVVGSGSGNVGGGNVSNITVSCTTNKFTIGGNVTGTGSGTVTLQNNGGDTLALNTNGAFTFATSIASGQTYSVTATSPTRLCTASHASGTVGNADVTNVSVACTAAPSSCQGGTDPKTGSAWVVCSSSGTEAWVSANTGGSYHSDYICKSLGYSTMGSYGGTCGNVCGYCQGGTSCSANGNKNFDGGGLNGSDELGRILSYTVMWQCLK